MKYFMEIDGGAMADLPFSLASVGDAPHQGTVVRPAGLPRHEFIWVLSGRGEFRVRDAEFTLGEGEGVFIRQAVPHSYRGDPFYTRWFTFSSPDSLLSHLGVGDHLRFRVPDFLNAETEALSAHATGKSTVLSRASAAYALTLSLFEAILPFDDTVEARVRRFLETHYAEPLSLDDVANAVGMNRFSLCRLYRRERGAGVMEELNAIRIAKAKAFLASGTESVARVGALCGFPDPSYFSLRFRTAAGCTPGEYRALHIK